MPAVRGAKLLSSNQFDGLAAQGSHSAQQLLENVNDAPRMDVVHYANPYGDDEAPAAEEQAAAPADERILLVSCTTSDGKVEVFVGPARLEEVPEVPAARMPPLSHTQACKTHAKNFWVISVLTVFEGGERNLEELARQNGLLGNNCPFFVGTSRLAAEIFVMWKCGERDRHKPKRFEAPHTSCEMFSLRKAGNQSEKLVSTLLAFRARCAKVFTNLSVVTSSGAGDGEKVFIPYDDALDAVAAWGVQKFTSFVEDAKYKLHMKQQLTNLEDRCLVSRATLMEVVKLREDAGDYVFYTDSEKHLRACPKAFADGATDYAKKLPLVLWEPREQTFRVFTLEQWLNGEEHLLTTLLLLGEGAAGKSKLMHMLAQELCQAYESPCYIFAKAIDPLGMLSHTGEVRKSAVLMLTDFKFRTARKGDLDGEDLKSLLDVVEGGTIADTRYRPAIFPEGLCRIMAMNASAQDSGSWFRKYNQHGIASVCEELSKIADLPGTANKAKGLYGNDPAVKQWMAARKTLMELSADEQAACRRVCIGFVDRTQVLISEDTIRSLRATASAKAAAGLARRAAASSASGC